MKARKITGIVAAIVAAIVLAMVVFYWHKLGCNGWSLVGAVAGHGALMAGIWYSIDTQIREAQK